MKKIITYGTFDLFHEGHLNLLRRARELGDHLTVGVTTEQFDVSRGKMNVTDSLMRRIDNVRESGYADEVIIEDHEGQKAEDIQKYGIDVFVLGSDWRGKFDYLSKFCEVTYLERTNGISTTDIKNARGRVVNLGIAGTGRIASRTFEEIHFVNGLAVAGAYNPHIKSAEAFAHDRDVAYFTDDYDRFLENVDAVYIATPHETHYDYCRRALNAGKHVLCEKPLVLSEVQARELFELADRYKLIMMEAIKTAYTPGFNNLLAVCRSGRIGRITDVEAAFTKLIAYNPKQREYAPPAGGSFYELGSYPLLAVIKLLGEKYREMRIHTVPAQNGTDSYAKVMFEYGEGQNRAFGTAKTGLGVKSEGQLLVSGTGGYILVKSPWWLMSSFEVCYEDPGQNELLTAPFYGYGLRFELSDFVKNINAPFVNNYKLTPSDSMAIASIMEQFGKHMKQCT